VRCLREVLPRQEGLGGGQGGQSPSPEVPPSELSVGGLTSRTARRYARPRYRQYKAPPVAFEAAASTRVRAKQSSGGKMFAAGVYATVKGNSVMQPRRCWLQTVVTEPTPTFTAHEFQRCACSSCRDNKRGQCVWYSGCYAAVVEPVHAEPPLRR